MIRLWDSATGTEVQRMKGHVNCVYGLAFSPDGRWLASASWDRSIRLWDSTRPAKRWPSLGGTQTGLSASLSARTEPAWPQVRPDGPI